MISVVTQTTFEVIKDYLRYLLGDSVTQQVFFVVLFVLLFNFVFYRVLNRIHDRLQKTANPWDDAVVDAIRQPMRYLVWIVGISFAAEIVAKDSKAEIFNAIDPIRSIGVILMIAWFLLRLIRKTEANIVELKKLQQKEVDNTTVQAVAKLVRISVVITATLVALQTLGLKISGVLAFGGIGGIAVGFAAKDLLANFFGAMMIYLDRPFSIGDWVKSPDRKIEGTVEAIGWRLTRIRTFDKRPLYIPNSVFASIVVENPSRMTNRRIYETIGIRYDDCDKMPAILTKVKAMLRSHEEIDQSQTLMVNFNSFAPSSLDFFVYTFTKTTNWIRFHEVKQDVLLKIIEIIEQEGAEIAFPTSTVHVANEVKLGQTAPVPLAQGGSD